MASDRAPWEPESAAGPYDPSAGDLAELRELILGAERRRLDALEARLDTADGRADVEASGQPCRRDPEDAELQVPRACDAVGQDAGDGQTVETVAFHAVVGGDDTHRDLQ